MCQGSVVHVVIVGPKTPSPVSLREKGFFKRHLGLDKQDPSEILGASLNTKKESLGIFVDI